jgi:hypothetical protein
MRVCVRGPSDPGSALLLFLCLVLVLMLMRRALCCAVNPLAQRKTGIVSKKHIVSKVVGIVVRKHIHIPKLVFVLSETPSRGASSSWDTTCSRSS